MRTWELVTGERAQALIARIAQAVNEQVTSIEDRIRLLLNGT